METAETEYKEESTSSSLIMQTRSTKNTLKEVNIPPTRIKSSMQPKKGSLALRSPSPSSSLSDFERSNSEYETPNTSTAVTPAVSLSVASNSANTGSHMDKSGLNSKQNKAKSEKLDGDALLAQTLQEEEYQDVKPIRRNLKRPQRVLMEDTEDEELGFSDPTNRESTKTDHQPIKRTKTNGRLSLPTRVARNSAQRSITAKMSHEIMDTDSNESELSEFTSDEDTEDSEEFEASEDEAIEQVVTTTSAAAARPPATTIATSARRQNLSAARQRRRNVPAAGANRSRHRNDWHSRMISRVRLSIIFLFRLAHADDL